MGDPVSGGRWFAGLRRFVNEGVPKYLRTGLGLITLIVLLTLGIALPLLVAGIGGVAAARMFYTGSSWLFGPRGAYLKVSGQVGRMDLRAAGVTYRKSAFWDTATSTGGAFLQVRNPNSAVLCAWRSSCGDRGDTVTEVCRGTQPPGCGRAYEVARRHILDSTLNPRPDDGSDWYSMEIGCSPGPSFLVVGIPDSTWCSIETTTALPPTSLQGEGFTPYVDAVRLRFMPSTSTKRINVRTWVSGHWLAVLDNARWTLPEGAQWTSDGDTCWLGFGGTVTPAHSRTARVVGAGRVEIDARLYDARGPLGERPAPATVCLDSASGQAILEGGCSELVVQDGRATARIGHSSVEADSLDELRATGLFVFKYVAGRDARPRLYLQGKASSVQVNGEEQLKSRWTSVSPGVRGGLAGAATGVVGGLVAQLAVLTFRRRRSSKRPESAQPKI